MYIVLTETCKTTYQIIHNFLEHVEGLKSEADILPVGVNNYTGLGVSPWQEVVVTSIKDSICWLGGGRGRWNIFI